MQQGRVRSVASGQRSNQPKWLVFSEAVIIGWRVADAMLIRVLPAVGASTVIFVVALLAGRYSPGLASPFVPSSFVTHTVMLLLALVVMWTRPGLSLTDFGFTRGSFRWTPGIFLWALPTASLSALSLALPQGAEPRGPAAGFSALQIVLFVWIYATVVEEILTRGLLQTLVARKREAAIRHGWLSESVLVSGVFFGAMHLVLIRSMGAAAVVPIALATLLGIVAARYRESTGSLLPAILVHALFNIGGSLPLWIVEWLRSR
jgi:membrane protease YdiL (CAAX protease family)